MPTSRAGCAPIYEVYHTFPPIGTVCSGFHVALAGFQNDFFWTTATTDFHGLFHVGFGDVLAGDLLDDLAGFGEGSFITILISHLGG